MSKEFTKCRTIKIYPEGVIVDAGGTQAYIAEAFDKKGNRLGDITGLTQFTISQDAGGSWTDNTYHTQYAGSWIVSAKFRRFTAQALLSVNENPEPPAPPPEPPPPIPSSIVGTLYRTFGRIGEYEDVTAFVYLNGVAMVHIESNEGSKDYSLPSCDGIFRWYVKTVLTARDELWVAFGVPITINQYRITGSGLTLLSTVNFGDADTRLVDFIRLSSGKLLVAWYQHVSGNYGINVGFAYRDSSWQTIPYTWVSLNHWSTHATVCQHPDGSIWWFSIGDGNRTIKVVHLTEAGDSISVDWTDFNFIVHDDEPDVQPSDELPWLSSVADSTRDAIILAYHNNYWQIFSGLPNFCKGAKISVIQCNSDGSRELLFILDNLSERVIQFDIGINDGIWLAYGQVDPIALTWNDLYITKNGQDRYWGKLKGGVPQQQVTTFCHSLDRMIANMDDNYIHFFNTTEKGIQK